MSEQQNINFVLEVEKHPCLYNTSLSSYSRKTDTDRAWEEVGKVVNLTGHVCKEKWRNLRVVFMRHMKPRGGNKKKPYYLLDVMQFLTPYIKSLTPTEAGNLPSTSSTSEAKPVSETGDDTNHSEISNEICDSEPISPNPYDNAEPPLKRQKRSLHEIDPYSSMLRQHARVTEPQTSKEVVTSFLNSLAPELQEMNLTQFKTFKRKVLALIDDIMESSATSASRPTSQSLQNAVYIQQTYSPSPAQYVQLQQVPTPNPLDFNALSQNNESNSRSSSRQEAQDIKPEYGSF